MYYSNIFGHMNSHQNVECSRGQGEKLDHKDRQELPPSKLPYKLGHLITGILLAVLSSLIVSVVNFFRGGHLESKLRKEMFTFEFHFLST